jgi:coenzyme F420-0:L-glutamate ligase/coenzyme F420-1:gamma-L-glutamate ligase
VAIGVAGLEPLKSYVGQADPYGYELRTTVMASADELAAAAELVMGKLRKVPAVLIRGYAFEPTGGSARSLIREASLDLFR